MDKNEILNALKLQAELNRESMRYYDAMIKKATNNSIDASEFLGDQIIQISSLDIGSVEYLINLVSIANKFGVNPLEAILRETLTLRTVVMEKGDDVEEEENE